MSKFGEVQENNTNGANSDVSTEDILQTLESWDSMYGIEISDVSHDRLLVKFHSLPENSETLVKKIHEFCPDVIEQHFGCMDEMVEMIEESGQELSPEMSKLIEGVNFEDENFGEILLQKSLKLTKTLALWWD